MAKVLAGACYYSGKYFVGCKSFSIKAKMLILFISACLSDAAAPFLIRDSVLRQNKTVKLMPQSKKSKKKKKKQQMHIFNENKYKFNEI